MTKIIIKPEGTEGFKTLVKGALENEIQLIKAGLEKTRKSIKKYEDKYKIDSKMFYEKFSSGNIGDNIEYMK